MIEKEGSIETRQELDVALTKKAELQSESGSWKLIDDIWLKDLNTFKIKREGIEPAETN
jgi:hypothetical protein